MFPALRILLGSGFASAVVLATAALGCSTVLIEDGSGGAGGSGGPPTSSSTSWGTQGSTTGQQSGSTATGQSSSSTGPCVECEGTDCPGSHQWSQRFGDGQDQFGSAVVTDAEANIVVAGSFLGSVDFGGGPLVADTSSGLVMPFFVAKLDPAGQHLWSRQFGGITVQGAVGAPPTHLATDNDGSVIFAGYSYDSPGAFGCPGDHGGFVVKLDGAGNELWARCFSGTGAATVHGVATGNDGEVVVAGQLEGTADFGGGPLSSPNGASAFLVKLDAAGDHVWSKRFAGDASGASGVAVDLDGTILLTGGFAFSVDFGGGSLTANGSDAFVAKLDPSGDHLWSKSGGGAGPGSRAESVAIDAGGDLFVAGISASATSFFGGGPLQSATNDALFVAKLSGSGTSLWSKSFGEFGFSPTLATDASGNLFVADVFGGTLSFGGCSFMSANGDGFAIAKLDAFGNHLWSKRSGSAQPAGVALGALAADPQGNAIVTGVFWGELDLGGGPLTSEWADVFLVKLAP